MDSLRYGVNEMHVDGFRFDLASILARDSSGVMSNPPVLWDIESDPALAGTKMIAEAWDAAGLYQVGNFPGDAWKEWNDRFRDDVPDFFRGANDSVGRTADRLLGSPSIYGPKERKAEESVNFVACHDGFTLNDVVSHNHKHNDENGEDNRDGPGATEAGTAEAFPLKSKRRILLVCAPAVAALRKADQAHTLAQYWFAVASRLINALTSEFACGLTCFAPRNKGPVGFEALLLKTETPDSQES